MTVADGTKRCACYEHADSRECYELRYYGYSPIMRDASEHSEDAYLPVDPDGDCDCPCHWDDDENSEGK